MRAVYYTLALGGLGLAIWAKRALPPGTEDFPVPVTTPTQTGPYALLPHPMYTGTVLMVTGMGGLAGGVWNALALFTLSELVVREWAWRETKEKGASVAPSS